MVSAVCPEPTADGSASDVKCVVAGCVFRMRMCPSCASEYAYVAAWGDGQGADIGIPELMWAYVVRTPCVMWAYVVRTPCVRPLCITG